MNVHIDMTAWSEAMRGAAKNIEAMANSLTEALQRARERKGTMTQAGMYDTGGWSVSIPSDELDEQSAMATHDPFVPNDQLAKVSGGILQGVTATPTFIARLAALLHRDEAYALDWLIAKVAADRRCDEADVRAELQL